MKSRTRRATTNDKARAGLAAKEVVLAAVVLLIFTCGMYGLAQQSFARLYHFVSLTAGSPYL